MSMTTRGGALKVGSIARTVRAKAKLFALFNLTLVGLVFFGILIVNSSSEAFATSSTTTVSCTPNPVFINQATTCTATVSVETGGATPTGTVTFNNGGKAGSFTDPTPAGECTLSSGSCSVTYVPAAGDAGTTTITGNYSGDGFHPASSGNTSLAVNLRTTTTTVTCSPGTVAIDAKTTCTATVDDTAAGTTSAPEGTVSFSSSGPGDFSNPQPGGTAPSCNLSAVDADTSSCTIEYTPTGNAGTHTITGSYTPAGASTGVHDTSSDTFDVTVTLRTTVTTVTCSATPLVVNEQTICTVTMTDTSPGTPSFPTGTVTFSNSPAGEGSFDTTTCTLNAIGQCTVKYTPSSGDTSPHTITASYGGSSKHPASSDTFDQVVVKRASDLLLSCTPVDIFINQEITCTVTVEDDTTVGTASTPTGNVSFDDGGKAGTFSGAPCTLSSGSCSVNYTPAAGDAGTGFDTTTITATYGGSSVHQTSSDSNQLTVRLRPTSTVIMCKNSANVDSGELFVNETGTCTVTVRDEGPTASALAPTGSADLMVDTTGSGGTFTITNDPCPLTTGTGQSTCMFNYTPTSLSVDSGFHTIAAVYSATTTHASSNSGFGQAVIRRTTETTISCDTSGNCTATVTDTAPRGTPSTPAGTVINVVDNSTFCTLSGGTCSFTVSITAIMVNVTGQYTPSDNIHLKSVGGENITSPAPVDASGGKNIAQIKTGLISGCFAASVVGLALDIAALAIDPSPDSVVGVGVGGGLIVVTVAVEGVTIPSSDIAATVIGIARVVLQTFSLIACTDLDGDGLPGVIELDIGTSDIDPDSDDDLLSDGAEIEAAGGFFGGASGGPAARHPKDRHCPDPTDPDSDGDGFTDPTGSVGGVGTSDGFESTFQLTDMCDKDTDDDGKTDPQDLAQGTSTLDPDTDDDGLCDGDGTVDVDGDGTNGCPVGFNFFTNMPTGVTRSEASAGTNPLNPDTDGDGLLDGEEDRDGDGVFGVSGCTVAPFGDCSGEGEPSPTDFDTDNDDLSDGFELGSGSGCNPADPDTDGDGLSDSEEQNRTFTTCSAKDSDGDGLEDYDEVFIIAGTFPDRQFEQVGDPLDPDTDDDGLTDPTELPGGTQDGTVKDTECPFINDDDSDDDAAQDGAEFAVADVAAASGNDGELSDDAIASICDPDSDGDGILDGVEIALAVDHLDWDSDDDGLSDKEELQVFFTNPNNPDTDGDTADGVITTRAAASAPILSGYAGPDTIDCLSDCEEALSATAQFNSPPDPRDQTDPLQIDTDGDGINDDVEFGPGCNEGPGGPGTGTFLLDGYANSFDSDADGLRDLEDAIADVAAASVNQTPVTPDPSNAGELNDDDITGICDSDSDGDGLLDGEEFQIGSSITDWDTDNDGRGDREFLGEGPIPTDPFDFDTDDDGLGDGVEVFGANTTNPVNADTDGDGLCDGGANTPSFGIDGSGTNPLCSSGVSDNSVGQIGDHPNPNGFGEDENGNGMVDAGETDPNQFDTDGDAEGDGVEKLGFSTSRQFMIPAIDLRGRPINVFYPTTGCMNPLDPDTDDDGLEDGFEDFNHDGNWDFLPSDFDHEDPIPGPVRPEPEETNPCDADSDDDGLNDFLERNQPNPPAVFPFNPTNPLDHDTDNDLMFDGEEVFFLCAAAPAIPNLDNDGDGAIDEDPIDGIDNDLDGKIDEDKTDFTVLHIDFLDPTNRDSDSDGFIDGLDADPCNSPLIPILEPFQGVPPPDTDNDGFANEDELAAGTDPNDPASHPTAFPAADLDRDGEEDDRLWLEDPDKDGLADTVALDVNSNVQVDARIQVIHARDFAKADFDSDGAADDCRYKIVYAFSNQRVLQPRVLLTIFDFDCDLVIDRVEFESVT